MALVTYGRVNNISSSLQTVLNSTGYSDVTGSPFLGSIVGAIQNALRTEYGKLYDIADNVDIGRAKGKYLDRWGRFHSEDRQVMSSAKDLSLTNCSVYLDPEVTAGEITSLGDGITLTDLVLTNNDESLAFECIDQVYIRPNRSEAFVRVICTTPGAIDIAAGELTKVSMSLSDLENVLPSAMATYSLKCRNHYAISSGTEMASEEDYRYVIMRKSESVGLFNEAKVYSAMDATDVVKIAIHEYRGGANVYLETQNMQNVDSVIAVVRTALKQYRSLGACVNVYSPVVRYLLPTIKLSLRNEDLLSTTQTQFASDFTTAVNSLEMGSVVNINDIIDTVMAGIPNILSSRIVKATYGGRTLAKYNIGQSFNEKVLTSTDRLTIT